MRFYIACSIGCIIGFFICAIFASTKIAKLGDRLRRADKIISLAIKVISHLCLWDDPEFSELREAIDRHEEN